MNLFCKKFFNCGFLLTSILSFLFCGSAHAIEGLNVELGIGGTFRNGFTDDTRTYKSTIAFPSFGISATSGNRRFQIRNAFEYSTFKLNYAASDETLSNTILTWTAFGTFQLKTFYFGLGGGGAHEKNTEGYNVGYSFFGLDSGLQVTKLLSLDFRLMTPVGETYGSKNLWGILSLRFLIASGD